MNYCAQRVISSCVVAALVVLGACGGSAKGKAKTALDRASALGADAKGTGGERCDASRAGREVSEYDTTGDGRPDVRKVYMGFGAGVDLRLVMICRETDINSDGKKDVIRYYDDDGRSLREEADRNLDGKMDITKVFQDGQVVRKDLDENHDEKIDTKIFMQNGKPLRSERDLAGRSKGDAWHPDRWEYYEEGRIVRMGTDLDGDARVDRWDRDLEWQSTADQQSAALEGPAEGEAAAPAPAK